MRPSEEQVSCMCAAPAELTHQNRTETVAVSGPALLRTSLSLTCAHCWPRLRQALKVARRPKVELEQEELRSAESRQRALIPVKEEIRGRVQGVGCYLCTRQTLVSSPAPCMVALSTFGCGPQTNKQTLCRSHV